MIDTDDDILAMGHDQEPDDEKSAAANARRQVLEELLKQKQSESAGLLGTYVRAYAIFLAITGAMLKFALDTNSTRELRHALCLLGFASCVCAFLAGVFGEQLRRDTRGRLQEFLDALRVDIEADQLRGLMYTTITGVLFSVFIFAGWIYIFFV